MRRTTLALTLALAASLGAIGAAPAAAAPACGLDRLDTEAGAFYLTPITKRRGVSCRRSKQVLRSALREHGDVVLCGAVQRHRGWSVRHRGAVQALSARFVKDGRRFDVRSQGRC